MLDRRREWLNWPFLNVCRPGPSKEREEGERFSQALWRLGARHRSKIYLTELCLTEELIAWINLTSAVSYFASDDFSINLIISSRNKCIQYSSPLLRHRGPRRKCFSAPAVAFVGPVANSKWYPVYTMTQTSSKLQAIRAHVVPVYFQYIAWCLLDRVNGV